MAQNPNPNPNDPASVSHSCIDMGARLSRSIGNLFTCCKRPKLEAASDYYDGSYDLYTMYNEKTEKLDKELVNSWSEHVRDLMVLSGLISAAIAAFLAQSYVTSFQTELSDSSSSQSQNSTDTRAQTITKDSMFAADVLWFWGLGASLSSAVLSTLLQSWVRRYVVVTQVQQNPRCRALIRAYVIHEKSTKTLQLAIDFLHLLLDFSIFAFLIGILGLLPPSALGASLSVDPALSNFSLIFVLFPLFAWYIFVFLISFRRHTIYSTPLSRVVSHLAEYVKLILLFPISLFKSLLGRRSNAFIRFDWVMLDGANQVAGKMTKALPSCLDDEIVAWLLGSLYNDKDFEQLLESIPGFYRSNHVANPDQIFRPFHEDQVPHAILSFVHRTLSSATTSNEIKQKRIRLSLDVMELDSHLHQRAFSEFHLLHRDSKLKTLECVDDLISDVDRTNGHPDSGDANRDPDLRLLTICITAIAISLSTPPQKPDDRWSSIIERRLGFQISTPASPEELASMRLVNLVRLVEALQSANLHRREQTVSKTLQIACSNFQASLAGHQHKVEFCNLWNGLQDSAAGGQRSNVGLISRNIQIMFDALHEGINDPQVNPGITRCTTHVRHPKPPLTPGPSTGSGSE